MEYVVIGLIIVVGGAVLLGVRHVREENSPGERPSMVAARRALRQSRLALVESGAACTCGGSLGPTGLTSRRYGLLLGCTDCSRTFAANGREVTRRRPARPDLTRRQAPKPAPQDARQTPNDMPDESPAATPGGPNPS